MKVWPEQMLDVKHSGTGAFWKPVLERRGWAEEGWRRRSSLVPSAVYKIFRDAILSQKQVACVYDGYARELCPIILGHSKGEEKVLAYQVGGGSSDGLPPGGQWKCLFLAKVKNPRMQDGPWREGNLHRQEQRCVEAVDIDFNIHVRKRQT